MTLPAALPRAHDVKRTVNLLEVAGRYTELKRRGQVWVGLCPLHAERTPSFYVKEQRQSWVCWGCGERGDVLDLVQRVEKCTLPEAMRKLGAMDLSEAPVQLWAPPKKSHVLPCEGIGCGARLEVDLADVPFLGRGLHNSWDFRRYTDGDVKGMCGRCEW